MTKTLLILALLSFILCQATPLQDRITIGKFTYKVKKQKILLKDEWYDCKTLSLYSLNGEHQAGVLVEARRNDTVFVTGTYKIQANKFITKEHYHYRHEHEPDSSIRVFVQNRKGKLELRSFIKYTGGVKKIVYPL